MRITSLFFLLGVGLVCLMFSAPAMAVPMCGDANGDGEINVGDAVYVINYIFKGGDPPLATCCYECTPGATRPCYSGPEGSEGVGVCHAGTQTCVDGFWGPCVGETIPSAEVCDGQDNDCDSEVDEGDPGGGGACNTGLQGICAAGTLHCVNGAMVCEPNMQPSPEVCDGLDNDCDGMIDEGDPGGGGACNTGLQGICAAGTLHCVNGAMVCESNMQPSPEVCDGLDNDCDGMIDEGDPGGGGACNTGLQGICAAGTLHCVNGAMVCESNMQPSPEACDGLDNDCDGMIDEGNPGGGGACNTGLPGPCAAGTLQCVAGVYQCVPSYTPVPEICNDGIDNDCDGAIDAEDPDCP